MEWRSWIQRRTVRSEVVGGVEVMQPMIVRSEVVSGVEVIHASLCMWRWLLFVLANGCMLKEADGLDSYN